MSWLVVNTSTSMLMLWMMLVQWASLTPDIGPTHCKHGFDSASEGLAFLAQGNSLSFGSSSGLQSDCHSVCADSDDDSRVWSHWKGVSSRCKQSSRVAGPCGSMMCEYLLGICRCRLEQASSSRCCRELPCVQRSVLPMRFLGGGSPPTDPQYSSMMQWLDAYYGTGRWQPSNRPIPWPSPLMVKRGRGTLGGGSPPTEFIIGTLCTGAGRWVLGGGSHPTGPHYSSIMQRLDACYGTGRWQPSNRPIHWHSPRMVKEGQGTLGGGSPPTESTGTLCADDGRLVLGGGSPLTDPQHGMPGYRLKLTRWGNGSYTAQEWLDRTDFLMLNSIVDAMYWRVQWSCFKCVYVLKGCRGQVLVCMAVLMNDLVQRCRLACIWSMASLRMFMHLCHQMYFCSHSWFARRRYPWLTLTLKHSGDAAAFGDLHPRQPGLPLPCRTAWRWHFQHSDADTQSGTAASASMAARSSCCRNAATDSADESNDEPCGRKASTCSPGASTEWLGDPSRAAAGASVDGAFTAWRGDPRSSTAIFRSGRCSRAEQCHGQCQCDGYWSCYGGNSTVEWRDRGPCRCQQRRWSSRRQWWSMVAGRRPLDAMAPIAVWRQPTPMGPPWVWSQCPTQCGIVAGAHCAQLGQVFPRCWHTRMGMWRMWQIQLDVHGEMQELQAVSPQGVQIGALHEGSPVAQLEQLGEGTRDGGGGGGGSAFRKGQAWPECFQRELGSLGSSTLPHEPSPATAAMQFRSAQSGRVHRCDHDRCLSRSDSGIEHSATHAFAASDAKAFTSPGAAAEAP